MRFCEMSERLGMTNASLAARWSAQERALPDRFDGMKGQKLADRQKPRASTRRQRAGLTLLDVVITVLLMAIVATVAQGRFSRSLARWQASFLAQRIAADIESVRQAARATSTSKSITFDTVNKTYTLAGVPNPDRKSATFVVSMTGYAPAAAFGTVNLGGDTTLSFNGFGYPDSGGTIVVIVGESTSTVTVDAATGNTTIT